MNFKNATEHKMAATFALHSLKALFNEKDGMERLKKVFLSSLLTPKDIVAQARKMQLRSGNVSTAIYEDIQYALYVEMRDNKDSRVFDAIYESAQELMRKYSVLNGYKSFVHRISCGEDTLHGYGEDANYSMTYFFLLYEEVSIGVMLQRSMKKQYDYLRMNRPAETDDKEMELLGNYKLDDGTPLTDSKAYQRYVADVKQKLAEYLQQRYSIDDITEENLPFVIGKQIHCGLHWDEKTANTILDNISPFDEATMSGITWVGVHNYRFSHDMLVSMMGDMSLGAHRALNHHPDVGYLLDLAIQTYLRPYTTSQKGLSRVILRKEITPFVTENIAAFYNNLVNLYYIDCVYKAMEQYRDEYYYNFSWFYDIEKQDSITAPPVLVEVQQVAQTDDDNAYIELNAQYERERKRVAQICQKHAHELAEKDRAIAAQITEIEKLQNQLQIQQEFISLASAEEDPDVTEVLDISHLYGKRFLFVGKLHESNAKLKQSFPTSIFMETDTANIKALKVDGVVFLIRNMGHSMYYKVMQSHQFAELPKIYCNSRNINNIYQSMLNSMLK